MRATAAADADPPTTADPPSVSIGTRIGERYVVRAHLGRGGMGSVYEVHDEQLQEPVALKLMDARDEGALERFRQEVRLARRITHINVARTHDIGCHDDRCFLTMELVRGVSLERMLVERGALRRDLAIDVAAQIGRGLAAAHQAGVVHRDLKPANVLVAKARAVITDFGIARNVTGARITAASQLLGTPHYMAPEQVLGEQVGTPADVYALGLTLFESLTGVLPFEGETPLAVALARCRKAPADPREFLTLPDALAELLLSCLALKPEDRPTASGVVVRLGAHASQATGHTLAAGAMPTPSSSSKGSISSPFAPMKLGDQALAVLPFSYRGSAEHDYLGDTLSQELIDVLSRTRGLKVIAFGATEGFREERDPRAVGGALSADAVVDGTIMASRDRVRVSVRLLDSKSGEQRWSERFDRQFEDIFELQEIMAQRIADALRVELHLTPYHAQLDRETMDTFLRARHRMHTAGQYRSHLEVLAMLERCLDAAPSFQPALAAHALTSARAWWSSFQAGAGDSGRDWPRLVRQSVERAREQAPEMAETHFAAGVAALQAGDLRVTATSLSAALRIAPTLAEAHRYLGDLQCEAGRTKEGLRRLKLAVDLDSTLLSAYYGMARMAGLRGDHARHAECIEILAAGGGEHIVRLISARYATWYNKEEQMRRLYDESRSSGNPASVFLRQFLGFILGELSREDLDQQLISSESFGNSRFSSMVGQYAVEAFAVAGDQAEALSQLERIAQSALVDVAWMELCPALEPLRGDQRFHAAMERVRTRAEEIWRA